MKKTWAIAIVGTVLLSGTACNRNRPVEIAHASQLTALEKAYRAGVFTRQEYEARKAALSAPTPAPAPAAPAVVPAAPPVPATVFPQNPPVAAPPTAVAATRPERTTRRPATPAARAAQAPPEPTPTPVAAAPEPVRPAPIAPPTPRTAPQEAADDQEDRPATVNGCEASSGKEKGKQERFYPMPLDKVREAAVNALTAMDFKVQKSSDSEIQASHKRHLGILVGSGGERLYLRFEEVRQGGQRGTRVTGETKKNIVMRAGQKSWTNAVLEQTACMLHKGI